MQTKRQRHAILRTQLESERSSFLPQYEDLSAFISPRRTRFNPNDTNKGDRRNLKIIDSTGTLAARTLRSGMMGGITSPARPWFRLTTPDPGMAEFGRVKDWLHVVTQRMITAFIRSNLYNVLPIIYGDIGTFATSSMILEEDFEDVIRCYPFAIGSYCLANNDKLKVDVFYRNFQLTVRQLVQKFGQRQNGKIIWDNFSSHVRSLYEQGHMETWIDVCHIIEPNADYDENKIESRFKKYSSCYFEKGGSGGAQGNYLKDNDMDRYLRESGYDFFPVLAPRWEINGEDVYGTSCPGMDALGDIKQLQLGEKRIFQAIEKMVNPPMTGPTSLQTKKASILPGDITYIDVREGQQGFRPVHEVNPRIAELEGKQGQIRQRISRAYYEDLFLMLANTDRREITAREIDERHEEKLLALGPVLEQLNQDLLDPLIDNTFMIMQNQGWIPDPPEELQGVKLKVDYISIMAQAQKLIGIGAIERFTGFVGQIGAVNPEAFDKVDMDQIIDEYGEALGVSPRIVRSDEDVVGIRQGRVKAQQAQQMAQMVQAGAGAAKDLSQTDMAGDNALTRLVQQARAGQLVEGV